MNRVCRACSADAQCWVVISDQGSESSVVVALCAACAATLQATLDKELDEL